MNITEVSEFFTAAVAATPFRAVCVKKKGKSFSQLLDDRYGHGVIAKPDVTTLEVRSNEELRRKLVDELKEPFVTVRGHGWTGEVKFVWTGTTAEFLATWEGD